jgi:hypothetical protein
MNELSGTKKKFLDKSKKYEMTVFLLITVNCFVIIFSVNHKDIFL